MYTSLYFSQAMLPLKAAIISNTNPFLLGKPGIGKSSAVRNLKNELNAEVFSIQVNQLADRSDLTGQRPTMKKQDDGTEKPVLSFFPHVDIQNAIDFATENPDKLAILFLDEINRATSDITSAALSFITERRIGSMNFPDNIRFVAAGNDEGNITSLDEASRTRFAFMKIMPDAETTLTVIQNLNPFVKEVITENPSLIQNFGSLTDMMATVPGSTDPNDDDDDNYDNSLLSFDGDDEDGFAQSCNPRTIENLSKFLNGLGLDQSASNTERGALVGLLQQAGDPNESRTIMQTMIEGYIGHCDFTDKLMTKLIDYNSSLLHKVQSTASLQKSLPTPDLNIISTIQSAGTIDDERNVIENLDPNQRGNLLISLMTTQGVNAINDMDFVKRTVDIILDQNDNLDFSLLNIVYQVAQSEPQLLSPVTVKSALDHTSNTLTQVAPVLRNAVIN